MRAIDEKEVKHSHDIAKAILLELQAHTTGAGEALDILASICASICLATNKPDTIEEFLTKTLYGYLRLKEELLPSDEDSLH